MECYFLDDSRRTFGLKSLLVLGKRTAEFIATGGNHQLREPFRFSVFYQYALVGERAPTG
jgi:hypothetical protein